MFDNSNSWTPNSFSRGDGSHTSAQNIAARMLDETTEQLRTTHVNDNHQRVARIPVGSNTKHVCAECSKPIDGRVVEAMNKTWHPDW